jgi:uncharacterized protein YlzI (FlbEa/FlbD family)
MPRQYRGIFLILLSCASGVLLTGCALRALFGNVIIVEDIGEEVNEIITTVFSDSTAAVCLDTDYGFYECTYIINGEIITSSLYLLGEFGIFGVLIDPIIIQLPEDTLTITASYDEGNGPQPLLPWVTQSFQATPDTTIHAESGHKFAILELPGTVTTNLPQGNPESGLPLDYSLSFHQVQPLAAPVEPVEVKVMLTGKVSINWHNYYVPLLPCVTDFASIPALEIPISATPVDLQPAVGALLQGTNAPCDHQAYTFNNVPPPPELIFLPQVGVNSSSGRVQFQR